MLYFHRCFICYIPIICKLFCCCSSSPQRSWCENICWSCLCRMYLVSFMFNSNFLVTRFYAFDFQYSVFRVSIFDLSVFNFSFLNRSWIGISEKYTHNNSRRFIASRGEDVGIYIYGCVCGIGRFCLNWSMSWNLSVSRLLNFRRVYDAVSQLSSSVLHGWSLGSNLHRLHLKTEIRIKIQWLL